jgi:hypothetical protein
MFAPYPETHSRSGPKWVAGLWGALCVALVVYAVLRPHRQTVYPVYRVASGDWFAGNNLYVLRTEGPDQYRYSPTFAVAVAPLAALPERAGNAGWKLLNALAFLAGLWVWARRVVPWSATRERVAGAFFVAAFAALPSFFNGQVNLMVTGFVLLAAGALTAERWWWAASWLAAATLIKVFPLALALVVCALYPRRFAPRFAVAVAALAALPFVAQSPEYVLSQWEKWFDHLSYTSLAPRDGHRSLDALLERIGFDVNRRAFQFVAALTGGLVLLVALRSARRADARATLALTVSWFLCWAVVFGPATENATFAVLAPALAWSGVVVAERPGAWRERIWLGACVYLTGLASSDAGGPFRVFFDRLCAPSIGAAMYGGFLVAELVRSRREPQATARVPDSEPVEQPTVRRAA